MKRKIKKYAEGDLVEKEGKGFFGETQKWKEDKEGRKFTDSGNRYYSADDVKGKLSSLFGSKSDSSSKFDELESVGGASRRPRTIQEQISGKSEEAPRRQITDYIKKSETKAEEEPAKPTGKTVLNEPADIDEKPVKKAAPTVKKAKASQDSGFPKDTKATRMPSGYENLDPRSPQEKSRGKKQGVIQYEKGRSMSDWSRNLGKRPEPTEDEEDKPPKGVNIGAARGRKKGGVIRSASARADGCAIRGKTRA